MELLRKKGSKFYWYDFTVGGRRYRGSTKESNRLDGTTTAQVGETAPTDHGRHSDTKEVHVRVPIRSYQYLDHVASRYGMRSLSAAVNFLIEYHRECQIAPTLGPAGSAVKHGE